MSIALECLNIIIPISTLKKCPFIGDVQAFLADRAFPGSGCWHDEHLYREGTMNDIDLMLALNRWEAMGLKLKRRRRGVEEWHDLCVVDTFSGPTLPCRWLQYDPGSRTATMTDAVTPELDLALNNLNKSPLFQLSLASKELFHSNFLAWCCETWPTETAQCWKELVPELPLAYMNGEKPRREQNHHDLEIDFEGDQLLVVELKVKSLASKDQLQEYALKMKPNKQPRPRFVLMSLIPPVFQEGEKSWELENGISCSWVSLYEFAKILQERVATSQNCTRNQYLDSLLGDYTSFVANLKVITDYSVGVDPNACFFFKKADINAIKKLRLHDLVFKLRYQKLCEQIKSDKDSTWEKGKKGQLIRNSGLTNSTGTVSVGYMLAGEKDEGPLKHLGHIVIGIQLQDRMYRQFLEIERPGTMDKTMMNKICCRLRDAGIWFNYKKSGEGPMRNPNGFCIFTGNFYYNYRLLDGCDTAISIKSLMESQLERVIPQKDKVIKIIHSEIENQHRESHLQ